MPIWRDTTKHRRDLHGAGQVRMGLTTKRTERETENEHFPVPSLSTMRQVMLFEENQYRDLPFERRAYCPKTVAASAAPTNDER